MKKEEFNKIFKDTSREGILNQFYYEHIELRKMIDNFNELEKDVKERIVFKEQEIKEFRGDLFTSNYEEIEVAKNEINIRKYEITELKDTLDKIEELKGSDKK